MACARWWWWWGRAFAKREARSRFGSKKRNQAAMAQFRAAVELQEVEEGAMVL